MAVVLAGSGAILVMSSSQAADRSAEAMLATVSLRVDIATENRRIKQSVHETTLSARRHVLTLDFVKQIGPGELEMFCIAIRVKEPSYGCDTAKQGIAVLRGKAKAGNFMVSMDCQRGHRHHRLVEQSAKIPVVTPERKDGARHGFWGQGHGRVDLEFSDYLIQGDGAFDP